ncbi:hypothetical protein AB0J21_14780 [Streptomyces sp. NPDC049954]|uniref:hypothetical protein n=1 Tax=Streptomyces sp. NPDC049954 TaxID=3155779 RepID=UPI0034246A95
MPLIPEEPQIHESAQGPRTTPAPSRSAQTPRPVPGPRPAAPPRPGHPGPARPAPAQRTQREQAKPVSKDSDAPASAPQLQIIPAPAKGALDAAEEAIDLLLDSGRAPGEILLVTTGDLHPWAAHELSFGEDAYWAQHDAGDDVFYTDATRAARASARPVVVVAVNGGSDAVIAQTLPVTRTRAGVLMIVCGDPQLANTALGAGV